MKAAATFEMNRGEGRGRAVDSVICHLSHRPCGLVASSRRLFDMLMISLVDAARPLHGPALPDSRSSDKTSTNKKMMSPSIYDCVSSPLWSRREWSTLSIVSGTGFICPSLCRAVEVKWRFTCSGWTLIL